MHKSACKQEPQFFEWIRYASGHDGLPALERQTVPRHLGKAAIGTSAAKANYVRTLILGYHSFAVYCSNDWFSRRVATTEFLVVAAISALRAHAAQNQ
jgi:hypothetical protein